MPQRLAEELDANDSHFRAIIERHADAILIVHEDGVVIYANRAAEEMFARPAAEMLGRPLGIPIVRAETTEVELPSTGGEHRIAEMRVVATQWQTAPALLAS